MSQDMKSNRYVVDVAIKGRVIMRAPIFADSEALACRKAIELVQAEIEAAVIESRKATLEDSAPRRGSGWPVMDIEQYKTGEIRMRPKSVESTQAPHGDALLTPEQRADFIAAANATPDVVKRSQGVVPSNGPGVFPRSSEGLAGSARFARDGKEEQ